MKPSYIVYTTETGHTKEYAKMISSSVNLPCISLDEAKKTLPKKTPVIYMGWLFVGTVKNFNKAKRLFNVSAVLGVGLCPTGELIAETRKRLKLPDSIPLFTIQGGINTDALKGIYKKMIETLTKSLEKKKNKSEKDNGMLELLKTNKSYVSNNNITAFLEWYNSSKENV